MMMDSLLANIGATSLSEYNQYLQRFIVKLFNDQPSLGNEFISIGEQLWISLHSQITAVKLGLGS